MAQQAELGARIVVDAKLASTVMYYWHTAPQVIDETTILISPDGGARAHTPDEASNNNLPLSPGFIDYCTAPARRIVKLNMAEVTQAIEYWKPSRQEVFLSRILLEGLSYRIDYALLGLHGLLHEEIAALAADRSLHRRGMANSLIAGAFAAAAVASDMIGMNKNVAPAMEAGIVGAGMALGACGLRYAHKAYRRSVQLRRKERDMAGDWPILARARDRSTEVLYNWPRTRQLVTIRPPK